MRTLREVVADLLLRRLAVGRPHGILPPGADLHGRWLQPNKTELAVLCNGDALTLVMGSSKEFNVLKITPEVALRAGWFLVWRWWVRGTWCGLKLVLWYWCLEVKLDEMWDRRG